MPKRAIRRLEESLDQTFPASDLISFRAAMHAERQE